jgi:pyruvate kinase
VRSFAEAVAHASVETAIDLCAAAIVSPTVTGQTARIVSHFRPPCPIVAVTPSPIAQRELVLFWGVYPVLSNRATSTDEVINDAVQVAQKNGYVDEGDIVVITGGTAGSGAGTTNLMKVHLIERVLVRGVGLGERRVMGRIRHLAPPLPADVRVDPDEIVVTPSTDRTFVPVLQRPAWWPAPPIPTHIAGYWHWRWGFRPSSPPARTWTSCGMGSRLCWTPSSGWSSRDPLL